MILKKIRLNKKILKNRIIASPMCQYSSPKGCPENWHYYHYGNLINSGIGMMMIESTAVNLNARITLNDLVLSKRKDLDLYNKFITYLKSINDIPIGIQLSHAGRKGSSQIPWIKSNSPLKKNKWATFAPSPIARDKNWPKPKELNLEQIDKIKNDFVSAAVLAKKAGFDCVEVHMAHGYLLHQFLSPISNKRNDRYGGNFENRIRLAVEIVKAIKLRCKNIIIGARVTGSDRLKYGIDINESIKFIHKLEKLKIDYVCISSGGIYPKTNLKIKKGYNVDLARKIKQKTKLKIRVSGSIQDINYGNNLIKNKNADLIAFGRTLLSDPNFIYKINKEYIPNQYKRAFT